jgi:hypothetical protein
MVVVVVVVVVRSGGDAVHIWVDDTFLQKINTYMLQFVQKPTVCSLLFISVI